jgi:hypothetical protein
MLHCSFSMMLAPHLHIQAGDASTSGAELTLADLEDLGVIGSGSSGVAKKVRNKHTGGLLVLKVIQFDVSSDIIRKQASHAEDGGASAACCLGAHMGSLAACARVKSHRHAIIHSNR